ncbi:MAG: hypothetical protein HS126_23330 [Anaerolineales bacterium]|nr:hypothetical protein [Anaerolineales bacterium]
MGNWRRIAIILSGLLFIGLLAAVGLLAYRLGQQSLAGNEPAPTDVALASPSATSTAAQPPPVVTNTPTATPTPSPTLGPNTPTSTPTNTPPPSPHPYHCRDQ